MTATPETESKTVTQTTVIENGVRRVTEVRGGRKIRVPVAWRTTTDGATPVGPATKQVAQSPFAEPPFVERVSLEEKLTELNANIELLNARDSTTLELPKVLNKKARTLALLGRPWEAIKIYDYVIMRFEGESEMRESVAEAFMRKASLLNKLGRNDDAAAIYEYIEASYGDVLIGKNRLN